MRRAGLYLALMGGLFATGCGNIQPMPADFQSGYHNPNLIPKSHSTHRFEFKLDDKNYRGILLYRKEPVHLDRYEVVSDDGSVRAFSAPNLEYDRQQFPLKVAEMRLKCNDGTDVIVFFLPGVRSDSECTPFTKC